MQYKHDRILDSSTAKFNIINNTRSNFTADALYCQEGNMEESLISFLKSPYTKQFKFFCTNTIVLYQCLFVSLKL